MSLISDYSKLRQGKAFELVAGGVWYQKQKDGTFRRVVSDLNYLDSGYRLFCKECSENGTMYVNRNKPNYSITLEAHVFDDILIESYKK